MTQGFKRLQFEVLNTKHHSLLSLDTCLALGLLQYNSEEVSVVQVAQKMTKEQLFSDFSDVFAGISLLSGEYEIELDPAIPPVQNRPRGIPHTMKEEVEAKLKSLVQLGVIAEVEEPTDWISNMTAVWKADKKQVRVCLDPRDLNRAAKRNHFNMPTVDDILRGLTKAKVFSLLDAKDGFLHVKLTQRSSYVIKFWGPSCRYRWLRLPFGLSSAPEEFQRRLQGALQGLDGLAVVADDVLVYGCGESEEEAYWNHDERLSRLLQRAREINLKFNKEKVRLHQKELIYMGHLISASGIRPDPVKVVTVKNMPERNSQAEVRRFLGMCNYLARYMPHLSSVCEPLW